MNNKERVRFEHSLVAISGLWHTFDQWTKVLLPFTQWSLDPKPDIFQMLFLNALSSTIVFIGIFLVAQTIDTYGLRRTALLSVICIGIYQLLLSRIQEMRTFIAFQSLLLFNHIPMVIDSCVVLLEGEDGDDKRRTRFINKLTIPISIGMAAGPYLALQILYRFTSSLDSSQTVCGILHILLLLPLVLIYLPDNVTKKSMKLPEFEAYKEMIRQPKTRNCLILLLMVMGPYSAYDQLIRMSLSHSVIADPNQLNSLFLVIGATTIVVNLILVPILQKRYGPQKILQGAFCILIVSYLYLSQMDSFNTLLIGMPLQIAGVCICVGELSSQILSTVGKAHGGKAAALIRMSHLLATMMTPILTGFYVDKDETSILCYVSATISLFALPVLYKYCDFMKMHASGLPISGKLD